MQSQKMARGLNFRIEKVEGLDYLCSENKSADQLRGYREADLRLCFHICKMFSHDAAHTGCTIIIRVASLENLSSGFPTRSDKNQAVQPQKMARSMNIGRNRK